MSPRKSKTPTWVRFDGAQVWCLRCGAKEAVIPAGGMSLSKKRLQIMTLIGEAFDGEHAICKETPDSPINKKPTTPQEWAESHDVGLSSSLICYVMSGVFPRRYRFHELEHAPAPQDPADFGRCYRLLQLFPDWRPKLHMVGERFDSQEWRVLATNWEPLTALYEEELPSGKCPKLLVEMRRIQVSVGVLAAATGPGAPIAR